MNHCQNKVTLWMLAFCLMLTGAISPALSKAQASSSGASSTAAKPAAPGSPSATPTASTTPASSGNTAAPKTPAKASGAPSAQEIAAAQASGKVWVNTESGVYHKSGRWYGKTKAGKFMTESEAKAAGYKGSQKN
jgi:hypothetical protein